MEGGKGYRYGVGALYKGDRHHWIIGQLVFVYCVFLEERR